MGTLVHGKKIKREMKSVTVLLVCLLTVVQTLPLSFEENEEVDLEVRKKVVAPPPKRKKVLNWRKEKQPLSRKQKLSSKQKLLLLQPRRKLQMVRKPKKLPLLKLPPPKLPPTKPPLQKLPPPKLPQRKNTTVSKN